VGERDGFPKAPGVYFLQIEVSGKSYSRKIVLIQ
jgi:hypothetical protein